MDDLSLEQTIDRFRQSVVITVADAADLRSDASLAQPFRVFDRQVLRSAVRVVDEPCALDRTAIIDSLFQRIENEPSPGGDIGELVDPEHVRRWNPELPVHLVQRAWRRSVRHRCSVGYSATNALNSHALHQPGDRATGDIKAFPIQLTPGLAHAVDAPVLLEDPLDLGPQGCIAPGTIRYQNCVPKARILEAVREVKGEGTAQLLDHLKKGEMATEAERLLKGSDWLPEVLRCHDMAALDDAEGQGALELVSDAGQA